MIKGPFFESLLSIEYLYAYDLKKRVSDGILPCLYSIDCIEYIYFGYAYEGHKFKNHCFLNSNVTCLIIFILLVSFLPHLFT